MRIITLVTIIALAFPYTALTNNKRILIKNYLEYKCNLYHI